VNAKGRNSKLSKNSKHFNFGTFCIRRGGGDGRLPVEQQQVMADKKMENGVDSTHSSASAIGPVQYRKSVRFEA
jgi:hypothetical protein